MGNASENDLGMSEIEYDSVKEIQGHRTHNNRAVTDIASEDLDGSSDNTQQTINSKEIAYVAPCNNACSETTNEDSIAYASSGDALLFTMAGTIGGFADDHAKTPGNQVGPNEGEPASTGD